MIATLLLASAAWATTWYVDVCAEIGTDFADLGPLKGDDYMKTTSDVEARGVHVKVVRLGLPNVTVADYWAGISGALAGCIPTTLALDSTKSYKTTIYSEFLVNGETVEVYTDTTSPSLTAYTSASYTPTANGTWTTTTTGDYEDWNIVAAGAYAIWRDNLGNTGNTHTAYSMGCPDAYGAEQNFSCFTGSAIHIEDSVDSYDRKYQIAHEFGHALLFQRYGDSAADPDADPGDCLGDPGSTGGEAHHFISQEWAGEAFWEGFANYYATAAFNNNTTQTDCAFGLYKAVDWDRDGNVEPVQFIDCAGDPVIQDPADLPTSFTVTGSDYLGTYCDETYLNCNGPHNCNRATEFDWVEFLWHLDTVDGYGPEDVANVYEECRDIGAGYQTDGSGHGSGYPSYELAAAAARVDSGLGTDWAASDGTYGVDR